MTTKDESTKSWNIQIFDGAILLFEEAIPCRQIGSRKLDTLLVALATKHGLDDDEIISSYANKSTQRHIPPPEVKSTTNPNGTSIVTCEAGCAHVIATLVDDELNPVLPTKQFKVAPKAFDARNFHGDV